MFPLHNPAQLAFNWHCRNNNISDTDITAAAVDMRQHVSRIRKLYKQPIGQFKCAYCYANFNEGMIASNSLKHFPESPSLLDCQEEKVEIQTSLHKNKKCGGCSQSSFNFEES